MYQPILSEFLRQFRVFGCRVNRRFVRIMTHAGTRRLLFVALDNLSFFPKDLWLDIYIPLLRIVISRFFGSIFESSSRNCSSFILFLSRPDCASMMS